MSDKQKRNITLRGIGVSPGVVIGPAFLLMQESVCVVRHKISKDAIYGDIERFEDALIETRQQIKDLQSNLEQNATVQDASILDAHLMALDDHVFVGNVIKKIEAQTNVEAAVSEVLESYAKILSSVEDEYLRERSADVRDVAKRMINNLTKATDASVLDLSHKHVVIAKDLSPSETAGMRKDMVIGFATEVGSPTSHSAVMARALEIPAVVCLHDVSTIVEPGDEVLIDGNKGFFIINPTPEQMEKYGRVEKARKTIERGLVTLQHKPAETTDGHRVTLSANTEGLQEVDAVLRYGAEGVGLFRSEYLYLAAKGCIDEESQTSVYKQVAERLAPAPVIIRTMDIGGDKMLDGQHFARESNPFLGCRSIRLSLLYPKPFKIQLRSILRASVHGNVKLMYPMISNVNEIIQANVILEEAKSELAAEGIPFKKDIEVGIMVEIPAAVMTADVLAQHVDFFSIGTNDLIQYTLAVDRVNERVAYLYEPTHPAVLKLIKQTVDSGHKHGIWVGLCGEMAADPMLVSLLLGLGIDELSVSPAAVPMIKDSIRSVSFEQAQRLAEQSLQCHTGDEVLVLCRKLINQVAPELMEIM